MLFTEAENTDEISKGLSPMSVPITDPSKWDGGSTSVEEEMGVPLKSQWTPRDEIDMVGELVPLICLLPGQYSVSNWVLHKVKEIQHCVGLECEGFEEQFMALLTDIEDGHTQQKKSGSKR